MPSPLSGKWTIRMLVQNTYKNMRSRIEYMNRDVIKKIRVKKISVYDGKAPGKARTKYIIESTSYPQYSPYFKKSSGRKFQRTYKHQYDVTIQLDRLSIDVPVKIRTGAVRMWRFNSKTKRLPGGKLEESDNVKLGINGDFWFRLQDIYSEEGILYGRNYANGPPKVVNPKRVVFLDKHALHVIKVLMDQGVLKD